MTPADLVELLNDGFSHFDMLVDRYGLEKIKTIGDCYMVAVGVPRPIPDHVARLARLALYFHSCTLSRTFTWSSDHVPYRHQFRFCYCRRDRTAQVHL